MSLVIVFVSHPLRMVLSLQCIDVADILDVNLTENSHPESGTYSTGIGSFLGSNGPMLASGIGASRTSESVELIALKVAVRNTQKPVHVVNFLLRNRFTDRNDPVYQSARQQADHWHALLKQQTHTSMSQSNPIPTASIADELRKLADLKDAGIITADEFSDMKSKLISND